MHTYEKILQALGEASLCWKDGMIPTGVFDSVRAVKIAKKLYLDIMGLEPQDNIVENSNSAELSKLKRLIGELEIPRVQYYELKRCINSLPSGEHNNESDAIALCNEGISKSRLINSFEWEVLFKKLKKAVLAQRTHIS